MMVGDLWSRSFLLPEPFDRPPYPHSRSMITILSTVLLAETFWEKKHPIFGVSFGTLLLIMFVLNEINKNKK